jgi:hypothetical protein
LVNLTDTPKSTREGGEFVQGPEVKYQLGWIVDCSTSVFSWTFPV